MNGIIKSKPLQLLFIVLTMAVMVTLYPYAFAQYQFGEDQSRIIFSSSNSTQATTPPSQSNPTISSNGYSNSTQATTPPSQSNPTISSNGYSNSTQATTPPSSNTIISSNGHPNSTQSIVIPPSTSAVPEFGS